MTVLNESLLLGDEGGGGYQIERSLRFNTADSSYLSRTPGSTGNRKTWTWAGWVKFCTNGDNKRTLFISGTNSTNSTELRVLSGGQLNLGDLGATIARTNMLMRDLSAWYHVVCAFDSTQAVQADRTKLYVNGVLQSLSIASCALNLDSNINNSGNIHKIGSLYDLDPNYYLNGYLADIHFIDGQALDPTSFGEFDANNVWQPIAYTGSYGTNGFHLPFSDNSTAAALGTDTSGNGNTWTVNNISVAAGAGNDSLKDSPSSPAGQTDSGVGGTVVGNYCTFNPLVTGKTFTKTLTNGNLDASITAATTGGDAVFSTFQVNSGKWYLEFQPTNVGAGTGTFGIGMMRPRDVQSLANSYAHMGITQYGYGWNNAGYIYNNNVQSGISSSYVANDILMMAVDFAAGKLWFGKNGTWLNSGNPAAGTGAIYTNVSSTELVAFGMSMGAGTSTTISCTANFGQRPFAYTAPSGFKALCTTNLPDPQTITTSGSYTGNGVADGPFVYLNGVPTAMTIGGNAVTFGTEADKLSNGFKVRTTSTTYNQNAATYNYSITSTGDPFKVARAQSNP